MLTGSDRHLEEAHLVEVVAALATVADANAVALGAFD